jgi:hypothetical protein
MLKLRKETIKMDGELVVWKPSTGIGQVSSTKGTFSVDAQDSPGLADALSNTIIPPDAPVRVTFVVDGAGEAMNVVVTGGIDLAASGT